MYKVLYERDECTRHDRSKIYRLPAQSGLGTTNKQINSSRGISTKIGGCPMWAATKEQKCLSHPVDYKLIHKPSQCEADFSTSPPGYLTLLKLLHNKSDARSRWSSYKLFFIYKRTLAVCSMLITFLAPFRHQIHSNTEMSQQYFQPKIGRKIRIFSCKKGV